MYRIIGFVGFFYRTSIVPQVKSEGRPNLPRIMKKKWKDQAEKDGNPSTNRMASGFKNLSSGIT